MISLIRNCFRVVGPVPVHFLTPFISSRTKNCITPCELKNWCCFHQVDPISNNSNSLILDFKNVRSADTVHDAKPWLYVHAASETVMVILLQCWREPLKQRAQFGAISLHDRNGPSCQDVLVERSLYCFCCETPRISPINKL